MRDALCCRVLLVFCLIVAAGDSLSAGQANTAPAAQNTEQEEAQTEPSDPLGRSTPHGTVVGFLQAAQNGKYEDATQYLQLSRSERSTKGERIAEQLHELMDEAFV